jgi:hypothetical protein
MTEKEPSRQIDVDAVTRLTSAILVELVGRVNCDPEKYAD